MSDRPPADGPKLGLVLGGGAALGAAHAGVVQVLEEALVSCRVVAGTRAGALVGAAYAAGLDSQMITDAILAASWDDLAQFNFEWRLGLLDTSPLEQTIDKHIAVATIEELGCRLGALAGDIRASETVLLTEAPLGTALRATSAVPGLFRPVNLGGRVLVDGAFADNVPVWAARELGADRVIAVDLGKGTESKVEMTGRLLGTLRQARERGAAADENLVETTQRLVESLRERRSRGAAGRDNRDPDVLIRPVIAGISRWSPKGIPDLVAAGRRAAEEAVPVIADLVAH